MADYRDLSGLARIAIIVLWLYTACDFATATVQYYLLGAPETAADSTVLGALGVVSIVTFVALVAC
jgi:hypothetical protein